MLFSMIILLLTTNPTQPISLPFFQPLPEPFIRTFPTAEPTTAPTPQPNNNNNNNNIKKGATVAAQKPITEPTTESCIFEGSGFCQVSCSCDTDATKIDIINKCIDDLCYYYNYPSNVSDFSSFFDDPSFDAQKYFDEIKKNPESKKSMELKSDFFSQTFNFNAYMTVKLMCCTDEMTMDQSDCYYDYIPDLLQCSYPEWDFFTLHPTPPPTSQPTLQSIDLTAELTKLPTPQPTPQPMEDAIAEPTTPLTPRPTPQTNNNNNNNNNNGVSFLVSNNNNIKKSVTTNAKPITEPIKQSCIFEKSGFCQVSCACDSYSTKNHIINKCINNLCKYYNNPLNFSDFHSYIPDTTFEVKKYFDFIKENPESKNSMRLKLDFFLKTNNFNAFWNVKWMCCTDPIKTYQSKCYYNEPNLKLCSYPEWKEVGEEHFYF